MSSEGERKRSRTNVVEPVNVFVVPSLLLVSFIYELFNVSGFS